MSIHKVDDHGDCIIQLADNAQISILASAKVLMLASPVFSRMLSDGFSEGSEYATKKSINLPLLDDDPQALMTVCSILHYHDAEISTSICPDQLYQIAILADKYDLIRPLTPSVIVYCQEMISRTTRDNLYKLLFTAYVFDLPALFACVSWHILLNSNGTFIDLPPPLDHCLIRHNIPGKSSRLMPKVMLIKRLNS